MILAARFPYAAMLALAFVTLPSCRHCGLGNAEKASREQPAAPVPISSRALELGAVGDGRHRLLLDDPAIARLEAAARSGAAEWRVVEARCREATEHPLGSGYQGFDWADAVAALSLCWHATSEPRHARVASRYVRALLDDRFAVGDGKGGASVVSHDSGYGIRTFAVYAALGYDWLRGAPGMDEELHARIVTRLEQWLAWYAREGYLRSHPFANYYWGYLTALSFAGLAAGGQAPQAEAWLRLARNELETNVLPNFRDKLVGGGWPEGWQYGEYTTAEIALVVEAFRTGAGIDLTSKLPWLSQVVTHHVHALLPDGRSVYDGGTWGEHPARPSAVALTALSLVLERTAPARAAEARYMIAKTLPPLDREHAWLRLLAHRPKAPLRDPREGAATSLHLPGQGLSFFRSDWSRRAVWASFQAGPFLAADHQDKDQGHFELWRGADGLLVDGGDSEGSATINHNTLLIDDGGRNLNYSPNQGVWGKRVRTLRFGDDGAIAAVAGDLTESYAPKCIIDGCRARSVNSAVRSLVYLRPSLLVIEDRVQLERGGDGVTWAAHVTTPPRLTGNLASAVVGSSRVDVRMLQPAGAKPVAHREPHGSGEGPHRTNQPWGPMWRIEFESPRGTTERSFLSFISVDDASSTAPAVRGVLGHGLSGAVGKVDQRATAVLFCDSPPARVDLGERAELVIVAGLDPARRYRITPTSAPSCATSLEIRSDASGRAPNPGGFVRILTPPCRSQ